MTGTITETSSITVKENVLDINNALDIVKKLRGVKYNRIGSDLEEIGVIAEEISGILPQVVNFGKNKTPMSVSYSRIVALLIEAIKELDNKIENLKNMDI